MAFEYRPTKNIPFDRLTNDRFEKYGIQIEWSCSNKLLCSPDDLLLAAAERDSTRFVYDGLFHPLAMLSAIMTEFNTEMVDENDREFWDRIF